MPHERSPRQIARNDKISLEIVRSHLSKVWLIGSLMLGLVLIAQSVAGHYGAEPLPAWKWYLGSVMPVTTLIMGALCYTALKPEALQYIVRRSFYRVALVLSSVYLLLIGLTIAIEPLVPIGIFDLMRMSNYWLAPFQTLVASAIGALFFKSSPR